MVAKAWRTHRGQVTAAIHIAVNRTAIDGDVSLLSHRAGKVTVAVRIFRVI